MTNTESPVTSANSYSGEASVRFLRARFEAEEMTNAEVAHWLIDNLGLDVTSIMDEDAPETQVRAWAMGEGDPQFETSERMRLLYRVAKPVQEEFGITACRQFISVKQPALAGESILDVIATTDPRYAYDRVVPIARVHVGVD